MVENRRMEYKKLHHRHRYRRLRKTGREWRGTMKKTIIGLGIGWIFWMSLGVVCGEEAVVLKYRLETGAQYKYCLTVKSETVQQILNQKVTRAEEWRIGYGITVLSGSENKSGLMLRVVYDSLHYKLASPFHQYDCQLIPGNNQLPVNLQAYANLIETDYTIKFQNRPKIEVKAENGSSLELQQRIAKAGPEMLAADQMFPYLIQNIFQGHPKREWRLSPGAVWQEKTVLTDGQMAPEVVAQYRFVEGDANRLRVEFQSPTGCSLKRKWVSQNNRQVIAEMVSDLSGTVNGGYQIEKNTGLPLEGEIILTMTGNIRKDEKSIPTVWKTEIRYRLVSQTGLEDEDA